MDIFDELFAEVRSDMVRRESEVDQLAARATKAIEAWRNAKRAVLKYELASRMGLKKDAPVGVHDAALAILAACEQIPECAQTMRETSDDQRVPDAEESIPPPSPRAVPETAVPASEPPVSFPKLSAQALPMAIIGGQPSQEKLRWIRESVPRVEWVEMPANANGQTVIDRITNRRFSAIVLLSGMLHAGNAERVRTAAGAAKVPVASASTAGSGQLRWAFQELESKLRSAS